jgi:hypothetical protein
MPHRARDTVQFIPAAIRAARVPVWLLNAIAPLDGDM